MSFRGDHPIHQQCGLHSIPSFVLRFAANCRWRLFSFVYILSKCRYVRSLTRTTSRKLRTRKTRTYTHARTPSRTHARTQTRTCVVLSQPLQATNANAMADCNCVSNSKSFPENIVHLIVVVDTHAYFSSLSRITSHSLTR